jgi:hypothetical protein
MTAWKTFVAFAFILAIFTGQQYNVKTLVRAHHMSCCAAKNDCNE